MGFVKVIKNKAWFKRYQVKYRRRREGKTDYFARRKMVRQDKNKYNSKKYRLIVRFTNTKCICQVAYATIRGDVVVAAATSKDLAEYGILAGHANYACAYATGLLVARRTLKHFGLDETFKGKEELDGEEYHVEEEEEDRRPFKCILDVGLASTVKGARMWGALKGAVDGGLHVPHNTKNFPGFEPSEEKGVDPKYEAETHKERIFGGHIKDYMESMQEEDPTKYEAHFARYIKEGMEPDGLEELFAEAHKKIREDPLAGVEKKEASVTWERKGDKAVGSDGTEVVRSVKLSLKQRKARVHERIAAAQEKMMEDDE